jgi:hypothetical protein
MAVVAVALASLSLEQTEKGGDERNELVSVTP